MKSFTVHLPPSPPAERLDRAESLVFVKDGFSLFALIVAPIWMLANRLWLVLFIYIVVFAALQLSFSAFGLTEQVTSLIFFGLNLLVAFEADTLRRWTLERRGYTLIGTVTGDSYDVCQRRFFETWLPTVPAFEAAEMAPSFQADPFAATSTVPSESNLGPVREPSPRRSSILSGWRSSRS